MPRETPWKKAIVQVLRDEGGPLHYDTIVERISESQLRTSFGATPAATVAAIISRSLKEDAQPVFERVERGHFRLASATMPGEASEGGQGAEEVGGIVTAFGMYWDRTYVDWEPTKPRLLGQQSNKSDEVDFSDPDWSVPAV